MTYDQLVTLDTVVKHGSFKAASEVLHKSQPSLSIAIKKLEEHLGFALFSRENYRPFLTEKGSAFYQKAKVSLDHFHSLEVFAQELSKDFETQINLSIDAIWPIGTIKNVLNNFFESQIATSLNLSIDVLEGLYEKIKTGKCDFGLGSYFFEDRDIEAIPFMNVTMVPVVNSDFFQRSGGKLIDLEALPQIIVRSSTNNISDKSIGIMEGMKYWYTTDLSMKQQLIENGLGWGRLPYHIVENSLNRGSLTIIKDIPTIRSIEIPLYLLRNKKNIMGPNTKKLWQYFIQISKESL